MNSRSLQLLGWDSFFAEQTVTFTNDRYFPAKVTSQHINTYTIISDSLQCAASVSGKFRYQALQISDYPVVGDFVIAEELPNSNTARIHKVLKRKNYFSRKQPISGGRKIKNGIIDGGVTEEQVIASNMDYVFIVIGLDENFNLPRIERYLTLTRHQKLSTIILLNKVDTCEDPESYVSKVKQITKDIPIHLISSLTKIGLHQLDIYLKEGNTLVFLGSSGVGKSTLLNSLLENYVQTTNNVSNHSKKGKHTTTHRQMFLHPSGAMIIDTPGLKELQLWADEEDLDAVYQEVVEIALKCKFANCSHTNEPGCAVLSALEDGTLSQDRYSRYRSQLQEVQLLKEKKKMHIQYLRKQTNRKK